MDAVELGRPPVDEEVVYFQTYDPMALASFTIVRTEADRWYLDAKRDGVRYRMFSVDLAMAFLLYEHHAEEWSKPKPPPPSRKQDWSPRDFTCATK